MIILENKFLKVVCEERFGGRITSLKQQKGIEWLAQPHGPLIDRNIYDSYIRPEMAGWDEMLPTTDQCRAQDGILLPDHGEVWSKNWKVLARNSQMFALEVRLTTRPLQLTRTISLSDDRINFHYLIKNIGEAPTPVFWSAHPMISGRNITKVFLPSHSPVLESLIPADYAQGSSAEYWWPPEQSNNSISLIRESTEFLQISWNLDEIPYFGIFLDNGEFCQEPVISPQPAIAHKVSELAACLSGNINYLNPNSERVFSLETKLGWL